MFTSNERDPAPPNPAPVRFAQTPASPGSSIDLDFLERWLTDRVPVVTPPLTVSRISGGRSNLTHLIADSGGRRWIHRQPPLGANAASAHNLTREYDLMAALAPTRIPVPSMVGLGQHAGGTNFLVMEFVAGHVLRDAGDVASMAPEVRRSAALNFIGALAGVHAVEPIEAGLQQFVRGGNYIERQLDRWSHQWEIHRQEVVPKIDQVRELLAGSIPTENETRIVHGDYRLDNCIVGDDGSVHAILDWELAALGDPLVDLAIAMIYWDGPGAVRTPSDVALSSSAGFPDQDEMIAAYARASDRDLSRLPYYRAFAYWKMAIMVQGVYSRHQSGAYGKMDERLLHYPERVRLLADAALSSIAQA